MNEFDLLKRMRDEVPEQHDMRSVERRLEEIRAGHGPVERRRPALRLRWGLALAAACVVGVAAVQLARSDAPAVGGRTAVPHQPVAAAVVLEKAALVAARTRTVAPRPSQWFYEKRSQHMLGKDLPASEMWHRLDGRRMAVRSAKGDRLKITDAERGPTHPGKTLQELQALPADPDALLEHFRTMDRELTPLSICEPRCPAGTEQDVKAWGAIGWYMGHGALVPPDKAAAMYRALARIPNVTIEENATDGDGRSGIGVVLDLGDAGRGIYILDAADYHYLGLKVIYSEGESAMSVLNSGIVDEPGQVP
ncbi:hypothetical protein FAF44_33150 [Nonomuraea sp. MG754425]|uniref:CU044_5270 family protein n=1 Tax=Nonomuraea sp. MG754425 TaxID=2570319 RepID=UPI001F22412A|nr:CU044_5270 family protein [Nonomuraea sp. MG754425]MCF6473196.1 hypothetical protein [Nonomuraea sp. MG754425]